jgi:hypothetical protein
VSLKTNVTAKYLDKSFDFALKYHLSPAKMKRDRTTGRHRRLGGISDDFISGKIIELGVLDILKKINKNKKFIPDFGVRDEQDFTEPDIIKIHDLKNCKIRSPKAFVEIKHVSEGDAWVGLTTEQYKSMLSNSIVNNNPEKLFIVYATIVTKKLFKKGEDDLLGIYLKTKKFDSDLNIFANPSDLSVEIKFVITGKELFSKGMRFDKEDKVKKIPSDYMFKTEMFEKRTRDVYNKNGRLGKNIVKEKISNNKIPTQKLKKFPRQLGDFMFNGKLEIFRKTNSKSILYLKCISSVTIKNSLLGKFNLNKGIYTFNVKVTQDCKRNNIFVAKRNISSVVLKTPLVRIKQISKKI